MCAVLKVIVHLKMKTTAHLYDTNNICSFAKNNAVVPMEMRLLSFEKMQKYHKNIKVVHMNSLLYAIAFFFKLIIERIKSVAFINE